MALHTEWLSAEELREAGPDPTIRPELLRSGTRLGRYELVMPVAFGGMARVWAARLVGANGFRRLVAVKTILPHLARDEEITKLFRDEAVLAARVHHPNVCAALELGVAGEVTFLALEWIDGEPLMKLLRPGDSYEPFELPVALRIVRDACLGIHAAHEAVDDEGHPIGTIHRDLTPHNVMVNLDGQAKVVDFGVARSSLQSHEATAAGQLRGKLAYMPPEQIAGEPIDRRVDVFALGCMLYECVVGARAFQGPSDPAVMQAIMRGEYTKPSHAKAGLPVALDAVLAKALASDPGQRFRSAGAFADALDSLARAHGDASARDVGDAISVRGGGAIILRRARIAEAAARLDGRPEVGDSHIPLPPLSAAGVPSSSGVVESGGAPSQEDLTQAGFPCHDDPMLSDAAPTSKDFARGEIPSFVSSGDLGRFPQSGAHVLPKTSGLVFVQVILLTILVAAAVVAFRFVNS